MFIIGFRYFFSSIQRGRLRNVLWLTIISLSINIGVLITCVALIRGFESKSLEKILGMQGHARVIPAQKLPNIRIEQQNKLVLSLQSFGSNQTSGREHTFPHITLSLSHSIVRIWPEKEEILFNIQI